MLLFPLLQGLVYFRWGSEFMREIYPLVVHFPLLLLLYALTGRLLWPLFSILTAYLCCQLRRWIALFAVAVLSGGQPMQDFFELLLTLPLLLFLLRYTSPLVRQLSGYPAKTQCQFGAIPVVYYIFDYMASVYTDLLSSGSGIYAFRLLCCVSGVFAVQFRQGTHTKSTEAGTKEPWYPAQSGCPGDRCPAGVPDACQSVSP